MTDNVYHLQEHLCRQLYFHSIQENLSPQHSPCQAVHTLQKKVSLSRCIYRPLFLNCLNKHNIPYRLNQADL